MKYQTPRIMKRVLGIVLGVLLMSTASAQKYGATPEDSLECIKSLSVYSGFYKHKAYKDAIPAWKKVCDICPKSSKNLYLRGVSMYKKFYKEAKGDDARQEQLFDTLMWIYDRRIENFGQEGYVLGRKGTDMLNYGQEKDLNDAFKALRKSYEMQKTKTEAGVLVTLYKAMYKLYKEGKVSKDELIEMYPTLMEVVDANRNSSKEKTKKAYMSAEEKLQKMFAPVAECPDLIKLFTPKFDANPEDVKQNRNIIKLMDAKQCEDSDFYIKVAVKLNEQEPSPHSAFSIGKWYLKKAKYVDAIDYFVQAAQLAEAGDNIKEDAYYRAAAAALGARRYRKVRELARKILEINPNNGEAYILIGDAYAGDSKNCGENDCDKRAGYWAAYDKYLKAKAVQPELAEKVGKKLATAKAQFPKKADCFFYGINEGTSFTVGGWIGEKTTVRVNE